MTNTDYLQEKLDHIEKVDKSVNNINDGYPSDLYIILLDLLKNNRDVWKDMTVAELNKYLEDATERLILDASINEDKKAEMISQLGLTRKDLNFKQMLDKGELTMGKGLTEDEVIKLAAQYGMSPRIFREALTDARKKFVAEEQLKAKPEINKKREYLYHLTLGDDTEQNRMKEEAKQKGDMNLYNFYRNADKDLNFEGGWVNGMRGWLGAGLRNLSQLAAGGSVVNAYANDVRNAKNGKSEEGFVLNPLQGLNDYANQYLADGLSSAVGIVASNPAAAVAKKLVNAPLAKAVITNAATGAMNASGEGIRQYISQENFDPYSVGAVGVGSFGLPTALYAAKNVVSRIPYIGRLVRNARLERLSDPVSEYRQEIKDKANNLATIIENPKVNPDALRIEAEKIDPDLSARIINDNNRMAEFKAKIAEQKKALSANNRAAKAAEKRTATAEKRLHQGYTDKRVDKLIEEKFKGEELAKQKAKILEALDQLDADYDVFKKSSKTGSKQQLQILKEKRKELEDLLAKTDDEIFNSNINKPKDARWYNSYEEQALYNRIEEKKRNARAYIPSPLEETVDPIATFSNNYARKQKQDISHPEYSRDKHKRWEEGYISDDELNSNEYLDWYMNGGYHSTEEDFKKDNESYKKPMMDAFGIK